MRVNRAQMLRVERQHRLHPQQRIGEEQRHRVEDQHVHGIAAPALLLLRVDAAKVVEAALDRAEHGMKRRAAPFV